MEGKVVLFLVQISLGLFFITLKDVQNQIEPVYLDEPESLWGKNPGSIMKEIWSAYFSPNFPKFVSPLVAILTFSVLPVKYVLAFGAGVLTVYFGVFIIPLSRSDWTYLDYVGVVGVGLVMTSVEYLLLTRLQNETNISDSERVEYSYRFITGFWIGFQFLKTLSMIFCLYTITLKPVITSVQEEKSCLWGKCHLRNSTMTYVGGLEDSSRRITVTALASIAFLSLALSTACNRNKCIDNAGEHGHGTDRVPSLKKFVKCFCKTKFKMLIPLLGYTWLFHVAIRTGLAYLFYISKYAPTGDDTLKRSPYSLTLSGALFSLGNVFGSFMFLKLDTFFRRKDENWSIYVALGLHILVHGSFLMFFFIIICMEPVWVRSYEGDSQSLLALMGFGTACLLIGIGEALLNIKLYITVFTQFKGSFTTTLVFWKVCQGIPGLGSGLVLLATRLIWGRLGYFSYLQHLVCVFATLSIGIAVFGGLLYVKWTKDEIVEMNVRHSDGIPMNRREGLLDSANVHTTL